MGKRIWISLQINMLRYTQVRTVDLNDWDELVRETYGRPYMFQQQDGCKSRGTEYFSVPCVPYDYSNDSVPEIINGSEMGVSFKAWLERDPDKNVMDDIFWERNFYPSLSSVAQDLYEKGLIEEGEYQIEIDW